MCDITSGLSQAVDRTQGFMCAREAYTVRVIISFDMLCCFKTVLNTRPDVLPHSLAALSLGGSGPAQSVRADTLARGPSHSQESLPLPIGTAPGGKGWHCLLLAQLLGT